MRRRFYLWLARVVRTLLAWNRRLLIWLTVRRAGRFRQMGLWKKGSEEILSVSGLEPADLEDPSRAMEKLRYKLEDVGPKLSVLFFLQLCTFLSDEGKQDLVAALCELDAGIAPGDYADHDLLSLRLRERTRDLPAAVALLYGFSVGNALGLASRPAESLALLEAQLGLRPGDYQHPERLRQVLGTPPPQVLPDLWAMVVQALAANLGKAGRRTEIIAVLHAALGLDFSDYSSPRTLRAKMRGSSGPFAQEVSVASLTILSTALRQAGHGAEALALVEADFDLEPADYRDACRLAGKLKARAVRLPPEMVSFLLVPLYGALMFEERAEDALAVLAADAGFDPASSDSREVSAALKTRSRTMPSNILGLYLGTAALVLAEAGRPLLAVAALEADAELEDLDWRETDALAERVHERLGDLTPLARLHYVAQLASALEVAGRENRAALLVDAYVRKLLPLHEEESSALAEMSCILYLQWLGWWAEDASRQPMEICRAIVPSLRHALATQGVTLQDRERFIREAGDLRRRIVQTGLYWAARETDLARADELRRTVLLWDLELAQRLLVERFLLSEIRAVPIGEPPVVDVWPLPDEQPPTQGYLPDVRETLAAVGVLGQRP